MFQICGNLVCLKSKLYTSNCKLYAFTIITPIIVYFPAPTDSTCVVTPDGRIQAFQKAGEGTVYTFLRPCEHPLLTTCNRRVPSDFGIFIDTTNGTTSTSVIGVRINGTTVIVNEEYALPSLGVSVHFDRSNGSVTITISTDSPLQDECGLCGRRNGSLVLPNGNQINASRGSDVEEFITSYRVMPGDTFLMPDRRQCGKSIKFHASYLVILFLSDAVFLSN